MLRLCNSCTHRDKPLEEPCLYCDCNIGQQYEKDPKVNIVVKPYFGDYGVEKSNPRKE